MSKITYSQTLKNIDTLLSIKKTDKSNSLLNRSEMAMMRKLGIKYEPVYGSWNGYSCPVLGQKSNLKEEDKKIINTELINFRRILKSKTPSKPKKEKTIEEKVIELITKYGEQEVVALSLYNINKEAKKLRDKKNIKIEKIYDDQGCCYSKHQLNQAHEKLHELKENIELIYSEKEKYIKMATERYNIVPEGYHEFEDVDRDIVYIGSFSFHTNQKTSDKNLGAITSPIESDKIGKKMSYKTAHQTLEYIFKT